MKIYLAEYDPYQNDYEPGPLVIVGVFTTEELAREAIARSIASETWYYGRPDPVVSEWVLDELPEVKPNPDMIKAVALTTGVSIGYTTYLRDKYGV